MSKKFDDFIHALDTLCREHGCVITEDRDGFLQVADGSGKDVSDCMAYFQDDTYPGRQEVSPPVVNQAPRRDEAVDALRDLLRQIESCDGTAQIDISRAERALR